MLPCGEQYPTIRADNVVLSTTVKMLCRCSCNVILRQTSQVLSELRQSTVPARHLAVFSGSQGADAAGGMHAGSIHHIHCCCASSLPCAALHQPDMPWQQAASPVGDGVLDSLVHLCVGGVKAVRLEHSVPAKVAAASSRHDAPLSASDKDPRLLPRPCKT